MGEFEAWHVQNLNKRSSLQFKGALGEFIFKWADNLQKPWAPYCETTFYGPMTDVKPMSNAAGLTATATKKVLFETGCDLYLDKLPDSEPQLLDALKGDGFVVGF